MRLRTLCSLALALPICSLPFVSTAHAQQQDNSQNTSVYIVHGASGRELGPNYNPILPVDISVDNGKCLVQGEAFGDVKGPFTAVGSTYSFQVFLANSAYPCTGPIIYQFSGTLYSNQINFAVIAVSANHTLTNYLVNAYLLQPVPMGQSAVMVLNATDAMVNLGFTANSNSGTNSLNYIGVGKVQNALAPAGMYSGSVYLSSNKHSLYGPMQVDLQGRNITTYFLVGSANSNAVQVISKTIKNVY